MNCKRAVELMPLHAGGDIKNGRERETFAAHLVGCDACRRRAAEWTESRRLLGLHEPPEFDAAFFNDIRNLVMRQIEATPTPFVPASPLMRFLRPRALAYTASLAVILVAVVFALRVSRPEPSPKLSATGDGISDGINATARFKVDRIVDSPRTRFDSKGELRLSPARKTSRRRNLDVADLAHNPHPQTSAPSPLPNGATPNSDSTSAGTATANNSALADGRKLLRIELQTHDPNIRIIWLAPQGDEQTSPRRSNDNR